MSMMSRRWLVFTGVLLVAIAGTLYVLPEVVRRVAISRIHAITHREVRIDGVHLNVLTGRLTVRGFRLAERGEEAPFADFERLDLHVSLPSLLRGHLWIREAVLRNSTVRVVRFPNEFNLSDLVQSSGTTGGSLDVTVDRFALVGGTVTLEDRALPEWRTWTSEHIEIEANNVSTRRDDGRAVGSSVTAGAPVSLEIEHLRLYPIHLQATVTVTGLDLALARVYLPPGAPVILDRGRATTSVRVELDARGGLRAAATAHLDNVALVKPGGHEPILLVPRMTAQLTDFVFQEDGQLRLGRCEVAGSASVLDPRVAGGPARFKLSTVRVSIADLTWPVTTPGRLDVLTSIPGGGTLAVAGTLRPPPASSQLRFRLADLALAPWAQFLPVSARTDGVAEADLRINEPLVIGVPARVQGSIAVNDLAVRDARQELLGARRVEATGLEVHWPTRLAVRRLLVTGPRGLIERDRAGSFPLLASWSHPAPAATPSADAGRAAASAAPSLGVDIGEIVVRDGALAWHDEAVTPPIALDVSRIEARVTGAGWPLHSSLGVRVAVRPPGGGQLQVTGRVGADPFTADLRLTVKDAELSPYQVYVPTPARVIGRAELDLAVVLPPSSEGRATVRGSATLSRVEVRDEQRTVMKIESVAATGLDLQWPQRLTVRQVAVQRPWILLERDEGGALPLFTLLPATPARAAAPTASADHGAPALAIALGQLVIDDGGVRVVDRRVSPPFALDLQRLALRVEGFSTAPAKPALVDLTLRPGPGSELALRGTAGLMGGPLRLDVTGDLRGFAVPRTNPYLLGQIGWEASEGWLTTSLHCRIEGDTLDAKTDIRVSRLELARATRDEAEARLGLPLGLIVALMKDSKGDIHVSLPVGGRLSDPRFDFTEAIWSTVRNVAINAITAPVSWIGRIEFSPDSRIERIEVDPIRFRPGTASLTPDGQEQVARVAAFLEQVPAVRMALTPVVSSRDVAELKRLALGADIDGAAREARTSPDAAAARLFEQRFPRRPLPDTPEAIRAALMEGEPIPETAAAGLAAQRMETVRARVKQAGIDPARLPQKAPLLQGRGEDEGQIALDVVQPEGPARLPPQRREFLGVPLTGAAPKRE